MDERTLLAEKNKPDLKLCLFETKHGEADQQLWVIQMSDNAPLDLDQFIEIWFVDFTPAMLVFEMIGRHGFDIETATKRRKEAYADGRITRATFPGIA